MRRALRVKNYCNNLWPLVYDQYNHGRHELELAFYSAELASCSGPVLEVACGTGMVFLPLLERGLDIHGFDLSQPMLDVLFAKAERTGGLDVQRRVTQQNMVDFRYDTRFEEIFIPARSFLHLCEQEHQIACLKNIHRHLRDGGRLMLNFFTPSLQALPNNTRANPDFKESENYRHPHTGEEIKVSVRQTGWLPGCCTLL
jgi:SAM-dependent methyltransferase